MRQVPKYCVLTHLDCVGGVGVHEFEPREAGLGVWGCFHGPLYLRLS